MSEKYIFSSRTLMKKLTVKNIQKSVSRLLCWSRLNKEKYWLVLERFLLT